MGKRYRWIVIGLLSFLPQLIQAQETRIPSDSIGFQDFLIRQGEVPGLAYRFFAEGESAAMRLASDTVFSFTKEGEGYESRLFDDFGLEKDLESRLNDDSVTYRLEYILMSEVASSAAVYEYLNSLVATGDFLVQSDRTLGEQDLVLLANKTPYTPTQKLKLKFLSDYRLFIVTFTIVFFFLIATAMLVSMLLMKASKNKRENLQAEYGGQVIDPLTSLLFEKELHEIRDLELTEIYSYFPKNLLAKPLYQQVMIDNIISLNKKMKGEFKEKLKALYKKLEFDKISIKTLHHKKWDRATMALVHINEMDLVEALPEVRQFTNSKNFYVRSMAVSTLLNLSEKMDLRSLRDQAYPLSLWQQMNYLRIIRFVSSQKELKLEVLFDSQNQSIRIFGIKLVRILGRVDLIEFLSKIAGNVSDEEQIEILDTYATLGAYMETDFINSSLKSTNPNLSIAAAKAAAVVGDSISADILIELIQAEITHRKKLRYLRALYGIDKDRFTDFTLSEKDPELVELRNHILDPMLQNV